MIVFSKILGFLSNKKYREYILITIVAILIMFLFNKCGTIKQLNQKNDQNIAAIKGEIESIINKKDSTITYQKAVFQLKEKELKELNNGLYKEIKLQKGKVKHIYKTRFLFKPSALTLDNKLIKEDDGSLGLHFKDSTIYSLIEGVSKFKVVEGDSSVAITPGKTIITKNEVKLDLIYGLKKDDGVYKVFANPKNPSVIVTNTEGYVIEPGLFQSESISSKPKKNGIGLHLGYGPQFSKNGVRMGLNVSVGYNYNLIRF